MPTDHVLVVKALEHYHAYLKATRREDGGYRELGRTPEA
jgi:hypothetical protein